MARPLGLVLDGREHGGTMEANGATGETSMRDTDLMQLALGLMPPWMVKAADFDAERRRLDIEIDFERRPLPMSPVRQGRLPGARHGQADVAASRLLPASGVPARARRAIDCPDCGVQLVAVPWARPGSGFTLLFEALAMTLITAMPVAAAARLVGEHDTRMWRVLHHWVEQAVSAQDFADVKRVAIDETAARRGHDYVSLFVDIDAGRCCSSPKAAAPTPSLSSPTISRPTTAMPRASSRCAST